MWKGLSRMTLNTAIEGTILELDPKSTAPTDPGPVCLPSEKRETFGSPFKGFVCKSNTKLVLQEEDIETYFGKLFELQVVLLMTVSLVGWNHTLV